jgi:hypothetical protein
MYGELQENNKNKYVIMPFEGVHRLQVLVVTTMTMTEAILKERTQSNRKAKIERVKVQLGAEHYP